MTQSEAIDILKTGANVFLTGAAGSGKTYVLNQYIKFLKDHEVSVGITASTGIAATHMGGMTIHSWSGMGVYDRLDSSLIAEIVDKAQVRKRLESVKVLVIDEVSMLHDYQLDNVDEILRAAKKSNDPFGGVQIVLCGDFFQLPPVARFGEQKPKFVYHSKAWQEGKFTICYLEENFRQKDNGILEILNGIRSGDISEDAIAMLREERILESTEPTRLYTHNVDVDKVNHTELEKISGTEAVHEMTSRGRKHLVEALKKSCLAPEKLRLKKGARVMCVKNNFDEGYVNGTLGVVVSCGWGIDPIIRTAPVPDHPEGRLLTIETASWTIEEEGKVLAQIDQYPLRLAWAITVHKSQGMSLDAVAVDLSRAFEAGMGYVALSRARTLAGLQVLGLNQQALQVNSEVLEYDNRLRESSEKARRVLESYNKEDLEGFQKEFLVSVAPLYRIGKTKKEPKLNTYQKTSQLIKDEKSLREIAAHRGLQEETVIAQMEHIVTDKGLGITLKDLNYLKKEISQKHWKKIEDALGEIVDKIPEDEMPTLSAVKSKVGSNVSWNEIRLARLLLGYVRPEKSSR